MNSKLSKFYLFCILLISLTNLSVHSATQQQAKGRIIGRIIDSKENPVYPATISIEGVAIGEYTNENGEYTLENVPVGKQTLIVSGIGVKSTKTTITVIANKTTRISDIEVDNSVNLNEVAVLGKSEARKQQEQAFAITVLDLSKAHSISIPLNRLLNNVSGVRVRQEGGVGSDYNFSLNGFSGNQVKFFLDGIPMDNFGPSFNLNNISANMAERVEVYKGVLPVSLGGDALGGAVNIVSRKDANYLDASYSIGSFNTHRAALNGAYTNLETGFTVRANAFFNYSDNNYKVYAPIEDLSTNKIIDNRWVKRFHDNYQAGGIRLESGITNKSYADYLLLGLILSKNDKDVQTGATMDAVYGGVKAKSESMIPSIRYKKDNLFTEGLTASFYGAYNIVNEYTIDTLARKYNWLGDYVNTATKGEIDGKAKDAKIKNREWLATANVSYMLDTHQSLTLNNVFSSTDRDIHDKADPQNISNEIPQKLNKNITGLGWQIKYDRWNVNVFGKLYNLNSSTYKILDQFTDKERLERIEDSKTNFGYGASATYFILPKLQAKLSYEHAYRLPESYEIFGDGLNQLRNPDLKPESSDNANLGIIYEQHLPNEHILYFETNLIYRNTRDFILRENKGGPTSKFINLGKVLTKGIEGGVKYSWKNLLHAGANITYQNIIDNQEYEQNTNSYVGEGISENITYKERLPNIPYFFANGNAGIQFQNVITKKSELTLDYFFDYVHEYYLSFPGLGRKASKGIIPQQVSHDIALGYTLENGKYGFVLECTNITDEKLYDNYRLQKPGRAFNFKIRYFLR